MVCIFYFLGYAVDGDEEYIAAVSRPYIYILLVTHALRLP